MNLINLRPSHEGHASQGTAVLARSSLITMNQIEKTGQTILMETSKQRCLAEWETTNYPPCHPSDKNWNGCITCVNRKAVVATLGTVALYCKQDSIRLLSIADELDDHCSIAN